MDEFDFGKIDRELEYEMRDVNSAFDWNLKITNQESPPEYELVPIGEYNGVDLPNTQVGGFYDTRESINSLTIVERDYTVWIEVSNPERNCKVFFN